ncbi:MAG TPA: M48 family metallopeptidase [Candidatus Eisenbacteria bacterium]|nr:M48 family metallopeptidase [Candidatus Eisenbacteria bacterium]
MKPASWTGGLLLSVILGGCVVSGAGSPSPERQTQRAPTVRKLEAAQAERLYRIMVPLLRAMDNPKSPKHVKVGVIEDPQINAANAGGGQFYVTTGLLEKANDRHLTGIMAHEIAHDDLGHVAQLQILGAGLNVGIVLLEQLIPGSSLVTPIAGSLIARGYSRSEEYAADRHAVEILRRAGYSKDVMVDALTWVTRASGGDGSGGFLSTHPATRDRIEQLARLR